MIRFIGDIYPQEAYELPMDHCDILVGNLSILIGRSHVSLEETLAPYQKLSKEVHMSLAYQKIGIKEDKNVQELMIQLEKMNVKYFGLAPQKKRVMPYFIYTQGLKIGILSFTDNDFIMKAQKEQKLRMIPFYHELALEYIDLARQNGADRIIVLMNWSEKDLQTSSKRQREIAHWFVEQGIDLFLGFQTGSIQEYELYQNKSIFYSLGNCLVDDIHIHNKDFFYQAYQCSWNRQGLVIDYDPYHNSVIRVDQISLIDGKISMKRQWNLAKYTGGSIVGINRKLQAKLYRWSMSKNPQMNQWFFEKKKLFHRLIKK